MTPAGRALRGITWDHPRGYAALAELERLDAQADTRYGAAPVPLTWDRQPLAGFESGPIADLAGRYDLLVVDHPGLGAAMPTLHPLDELFSPSELAALAAVAVGQSAPIGTPVTSGRCRWTRPPRSVWSGLT